MLLGNGPVFTKDFSADVSVDIVKGAASGLVGGAVTTIVVGGAAIAGIVGAPIVMAAVVAGFATSWAFGEYVFDPKLGDNMKTWLKNK